MSTTAPGRRNARSGLDQLDVAEDLLAVDEKARVRVRAVGRALAGGKPAGNALDLLRRARFIDEIPVFGSRALRRGRVRRVGAAGQSAPER